MKTSRRKLLFILGGTLATSVAATEIFCRVVPVPPFEEATETVTRHACVSFDMKPEVAVPAARFVAAYHDALGLGPLDELREEPRDVRDWFETRTYRQYHDGVPVTIGELTLSMRGGPIRFVKNGLGCFATIEGPARPALTEKAAAAQAARAIAGTITSTRGRLEYSNLGNSTGQWLTYDLAFETKAPVDTWYFQVDAMTGQTLYATRRSTPIH